jgi:hypothetical protein
MVMNLGDSADALYAKDKEISEQTAIVEKLKTEKRGMEEQLLTTMQRAGTDLIRGNNATVSISETIRPQIQDIEELYRFVLRKKALHLFERRIAATAYRELKESMNGKAIPGLIDFVQTRLNVRKV